MAIANVQNASGSSSTNTATVALSPVSSGNTLVAFLVPDNSVTVSSITDTAGNYWMRAGKTLNPLASSVEVEVWYARGAAGAATTVTVTFSAASSVFGTNKAFISEFSGVWYVDPLDQTITNSSQLGTSPLTWTTGTLTPRTSGELMIAVAYTPTTGVTLTAPSGYTTSLFSSGGFKAASFVNSGTTSSTQTWTSDTASIAYYSFGISLVPGAAGLNPRLTFPETLVMISTTNNYLAPLQGTGAWTNISRYVRSMSMGPLGRQHELSRVQATSATLMVDGRDGSFNTWNTSSFLYNGGFGLKPMNPLSVTTAWQGVAYPKFFGYLQSVTPAVRDVLNVDVTLVARDILQMFSLKNVSGTEYAQLVINDGANNSTGTLAAFYRLDDGFGSYVVTDSSGNGNTGSLISGIAGPPAYGVTGPILYDPATALDLANGSSNPNGGFRTIDYQTEPPTNHDPLADSVSFIDTWKTPGYTPTGIVYEPVLGNIWETVAASVGSGGVLKWDIGASAATYYAFNSTAIPEGICVGSDGNLWVADYGNGSVWKVNRSTGARTQYALSGSTPYDICAGPDNNLWVTDAGATGAVWKVTTAGVGTKTTLTSSTGAWNICVGSDNNLWVTGTTSAAERLWRVTTGASVTLTSASFADQSKGAMPICNGPDGNLWMGGMAVSNQGSYVYKVATTGTVLQKIVMPQSVVTYIFSDGARLWISDWAYGGVGGSFIDAMDTTGTYQRYQLSENSYPPRNATAALGALWIANFGGQGLWETSTPPALQWTIECWFKWTGSTIPNGVTTPNCTIVRGNTSVGPVEVQIGAALLTTYQVDPLNYTNLVYVGDEANYYVAGQPVQNMFDGNWHHLVVNSGGAVYNSSVVQPMAVYVDGVEAEQPLPSQGTFSNFTLLKVGTPGQNVTGIAPGRSPIASQPFPGMMADVALYNGMNLTSDQIALHYSYGIWFQSIEYGAVQGDYAAGRFNKVLAVLGLDPTTVMNVPHPFRTLLFAETDNVTKTSALNYMQTLADTEPGMIFQNASGTISAYSRQYQYLSSTSNTSQATFGDNPAYTYYYDGTKLQIAADDLDVWNDVQVQSARAGAQLQEWGPSQSSAAAYSASVYGPRTMQGLTSLKQEFDVDALAMAQNNLSWYATPRNRITQIAVNSQANNGNNLPQMLGRGPLDQITVSYQGQTPGTTFVQNSLIEQISDVVDMANPTWQTTWQLSPYELGFTPTVLGSFKFGATAGQAGYGQLTL